MNNDETSLISAAGSPRMETRDAPDPRSDTRPSRLWLWFVAVFVVQLSVWTVWFVIASKHKVAEVPLVNAAGDRR